MKANRLLIELMALISVMPVIRANIHPAILLFVFVLWFINAVKLTSINHLLSDTWGVAKWWGILIVYELVLSLIGFSSVAPNTILTRIPVYFIPVIMTFVLRNYSVKEQKSLFVFIAGIIVFTILQNIIIYLRDPTFFETFSLKEDMFRWTNWGTSGFVACALFLVPCCFLIWQKRQSGLIKYIAVLGLFLPFTLRLSMSGRHRSYCYYTLLLRWFM